MEITLVRVAEHLRVANLTARGEAHVLRLSMAYALFDGTNTIRAEHITAAAELWAYSERRVAYGFGGQLGNPEVDRILEHLAEVLSKLGVQSA